MLKKEEGTEMKSKKVPEEIIVDYVAKERAARTNAKLKHVLAGGIIVGYMLYTAFPMAMVLAKETKKENFFEFFYLFIIFAIIVPVSAVSVMLPADGIALKIEAVKKFLDEAGQEATRENINLLMNRYYKGKWHRIEDMLYENRKVFSAENIELVSGNMSNENLKEALPAK